MFYSPDLNTFIKDETNNVTQSHKAQHLFNLMVSSLFVLLDELAPAPAVRNTCRLAVASCGNAGLAAAKFASAYDWPSGQLRSRSIPSLSLLSLLCRQRATRPCVPPSPAYCERKGNYASLEEASKNSRAAYMYHLPWKNPSSIYSSLFSRVHVHRRLKGFSITMLCPASLIQSPGGPYHQSERHVFRCASHLLFA
jgi:hypothetical protein